MTEDAIIRLIVAICSAFPALASAVLGVLRPDVAVSVREQLTLARALLPPPGSVTAAVKSVAERHHADTIAAATGIPRADVVRVMRAQAQLIGSPLAPPVLFAEPAGEDD